MHLCEQTAERLADLPLEGAKLGALHQHRRHQRPASATRACDSYSAQLLCRHGAKLLQLYRAVPGTVFLRGSLNYPLVF